MMNSTLLSHLLPHHTQPPIHPTQSFTARDPCCYSERQFRGGDEDDPDRCQRAAQRANIEALEAWGAGLREEYETARHHGQDEEFFPERDLEPLSKRVEDEEY